MSASRLAFVSCLALAAAVSGAAPAPGADVAPQPYVNLDPTFGNDDGQLVSDVSALLGGVNKANQPQTMAIQSDGKFIAIGSAGKNATFCSCHSLRSDSSHS